MGVILAVVAYTFTAQPATRQPSPYDCILIAHRQTRALEMRHCDFSAGRRVKGTVFLVD
jgi:hypothetical protein